MTSVLLLHLVHVFFVRSLGNDALFVKQQQNTDGLHFNQVEYLLVVDKLNVLKLDALLGVECLFLLESSAVELLLQLFVGKIDAQLFKRVVLKNFETKDIEDAHEAAPFGSLQRFIDALHEVIKEFAVCLFGKGVAAIASGDFVQRDDRALRAHGNRAVAQYSFKVLFFDLKELGGEGESIAVLDLASLDATLFGLVRKLNVSEMKDSSSGPEHPLLFVL
mmetsp:Transcript_8570/g.15071  ORF Transcript_8570/g.15071 Transcript_8570/m.15071 type:complete len:220 (-) Transcript_8570:70-729(-)